MYEDVSDLTTMQLVQRYNRLRYKMFLMAIEPNHSYVHRLEHEPTANEMSDYEHEIVRRAIAKDRVACLAIQELNISTQFYFWSNTPNHPDDETPSEVDQD